MIGLIPHCRRSTTTTGGSGGWWKRTATSVSSRRLSNSRQYARGWRRAAATPARLQPTTLVRLCLRRSPAEVALPPRPVRHPRHRSSQRWTIRPNAAVLSRRPTPLAASLLRLWFILVYWASNTDLIFNLWQTGFYEITKSYNLNITIYLPCWIGSVINRLRKSKTD